MSKSDRNVAQFDIWQVNLNPTKGSEQSGLRPCLILQTNAVSNYGLTTLIAPFTSKKIDKIYPYEVSVTPASQNGLTEISKIKFDQVRVIDKQRLIRQIGTLEPTYISESLSALRIIFDFGGDFR